MKNFCPICGRKLKTYKVLEDSNQGIKDYAIYKYCGGLFGLIGNHYFEYDHREQESPNYDLETGKKL